jgi:hypothetical protein
MSYRGTGSRHSGGFKGRRESGLKWHFWQQSEHEIDPVNVLEVLGHMSSAVDDFGIVALIGLVTKLTKPQL